VPKTYEGSSCPEGRLWEAAVLEVLLPGDEANIQLEDCWPGSLLLASSSVNHLAVFFVFKFEQYQAVRWTCVCQDTHIQFSGLDGCNRSWTPMGN
jgi:hypothetical protein